MMTRTEHLLTILAEECAEVAQRASKALRFGLDEVEPGQEATNAERLFEEYNHVRAVYTMLAWEHGFPDIDRGYVGHKQREEKERKVERFLAYSAECGTLAGEAAEQEEP